MLTPIDLLTKGAGEVLVPCAAELRRNGWPARFEVDLRDEAVLRVALVIDLPLPDRPVEAEPQP